MQKRFILAIGTLAASLAALWFPLAASAAAPGDLVKLADDGDLSTTADSAVYFIASDGKRYSFPNSRAYFTWYSDFDAVRIVSPSELASYQLGGQVRYRPGTRLVKITTDPKVYAVEPGGVLRWVQTEAIAKALFGDLWNKRIDDVPDAQFVNYAVGSPLAAAIYPSGSIVRRQSDGKYFRIEALTKREIPSETVRAELRVQENFVLTATGDLSEYATGTAVTTAEGAISDTSQVDAQVIVPPVTMYLMPPPSDFIAVGTDATLLELHLTGGSGVSLSRVTVKIDATTDEPLGDDGIDDDKGGLVYGNNAQANLRNIRLVDSGGTTVFSPKEVAVNLTMDQSQTFEFSGAPVSVPAGQDKVLYLKAQVNSLLATGQGYKATVIRTGTDVGGTASYLPTTDLVGPSLSTLNDSLRVTVASLGETTTYVRGAKDAVLGKFTFTATTAAPNVVTGVSFLGYVDEQEGGTGGFLPGYDADNGTETRVRAMVPTVGLYDKDDVLIGGPVDVTLEGKAVFSGLNVQIAPGASSTLTLKGDISKTVDLEAMPNRLAFDVADAATDVVVKDDAGGSVASSGIAPNGGLTPTFSIEIKSKGTMEFEWTGNGGPVIAGTEVRLGTLKFKPEDDSYAVNVISFRHVGTGKQSLGAVRLAYKDAAGADVSKTADFIGDVVTFQGVGFAATAGTEPTMELYGTLRPRDGGAVYGETIAVKFGDADTLQFSSPSTEEVFAESSLGTTDFTVTKNTASSLLVRFSDIKLAIAADTPAGPLYHDSAAEVLRFTVTADPAGVARIKRITFKVQPSDAGRAGSDNDALERWADMNGDFEDDDGIVNLVQVAGSNRTLIGEGSAASIRYSIVSGSTRNTSPSTVDSGSGNYGLIEYVFPDGQELSFGAGGTLTYVLELDTAAFADDKDYTLQTTLMGGGDFEWTDIPSGSYTPITGTGTQGVPFSSATLTVKK